MPTCDNPLTRKLSAFVALSGEELEALARLRRYPRTFRARREMIHEGQKPHSAFILESGWACSFRVLPGGERQIIDFHVPGDILGLRSILFRTLDHSGEAVTRIKASEVLLSDILASFSQTPRLATAVLWAAAREEAILVEHLVNLGRRSADVRVAHFLLELGARLELVGIGDERGFDCPLTQYYLADALGLSPVHVNRTLRRLREMGLVTFQKSRVRFDNLVALQDFAGFSPDYLDHDRPLLQNAAPPGELAAEAALIAARGSGASRGGGFAEH
ncbi:Crp/Fnr family transcriptional regulator [Paracoccaceae bacterium Fryx2]|nr:Crp/Fnr family transcriptional regulator [Paracoccaceae bacterium Fryx2]